MKLFIIVPLLFFLCTMGFCQTSSDTITIVKKGRFAKNEEFLNTNQLLTLMRGNPEAFTLMKKAKTNSAMASVLSFAGGVFIGLPLGTAIGGGDTNWGMMGIGGGLIALSIPLYFSYRNNSTRAVEIFNERLLQAQIPKYELILQSNANRVGVILKF